VHVASWRCKDVIKVVVEAVELAHVQFFFHHFFVGSGPFVFKYLRVGQLEENVETYTQLLHRGVVQSAALVVCGLLSDTS